MADTLTAKYLQLGTTDPIGLIIPVSANSNPTTISFYYRNDESFAQNTPTTILDARAALGGVLLGEYGDVPAPGNPIKQVYIDGDSGANGYLTLVIIANTAKQKWARYDLVFNTPRQAGFIYFSMRDDGHNEGPQRWKIADFRVYDYGITQAQAAQPLLPYDYVTRYNFADCGPGATSTMDISGNGNDAVLYS